MPKPITEEDVRILVEMIRNWPKAEPFKWETICKGAKNVLGYEPTRQALNKKPALTNAYSTKKNQLRIELRRINTVSRPRSIHEAMERLASYQKENEQLKSELSAMAELANRFIYNASLKGLSREQLMRQLPKKN